MPDTTPCVHCQRVGFVRRERVIQGGMAATEFYCGSCQHSWTIRDEQERRKTPRRRRIPRGSRGA